MDKTAFGSTESLTQPPSACSASEDDPRVVAALKEYLAALDAGECPDRSAFLERHGDIAPLLARCLDGLELVHGAASGLPAAAGPGPEESACPPNATLGDFRLIRIVGRGAMGIVYEAEQLSLRRRVALKLLPFAAALDPKRLTRFRNEAQAAAGLHHTNIVPVYAVGSERGIQYFAMQFIDGQTVAALIRDLCGTEAPLGVKEQSPDDLPSTRPQADLPTVLSRPPRDADWFRRAARLVLQVAEALQHAHELGIIHRDVKPGNLLLDPRGNVWLTDFGLAHVRTDGIHITKSREVLGTYRYMSPQQAAGKAGLVDERTDIYSLGATLYELLTLQPAFPGEDPAEVLRQIASEEPKPLRRIDKSIPRDLETIVGKAMEKDPGDRYATAQALADDLRRFLEDKPIEGRPPTVWQRARKWARRHRPVVRAATAALLAIMAVAAGSIGWIVRDREARRTTTARDVGLAAQDTIRLRDEGRLLAADPERWEKTLSAAFSALQSAEGLLASGVPTDELREQVQALRAELEADKQHCRFLAELADLRSQKGDEFDPTDVAVDYARAFRRHGIDIEHLKPEEAAQLISARPPTVVAELAAALDDWTMSVRSGGRQRPLEVARLADPDPWRNRLRAVAAERDLPELQGLVQEARDRQDLDRLPAASLQIMGQALFDAGDVAGAEAWLRDALERHPGDVWLNYTLATLLRKGKWEKPRLEEAIRYYSAVRALRPEIAHDLGHTLEETGDRIGAEVVFRSLTRLRPANARHWFCRGNVRSDLKQFDAAIADYSRAIELKPDFAEAWSNRGIAHKELKQFDQAIADYSKAIQLKPRYPEPWNNRGLAYAELKQFDRAIADYSEAIARKPDYARAWKNRASDLATLNQFDRAIADYSKVIELKPDWAEAWYDRGFAHEKLRQFERAITDYSKAIELKPDWAEAWNNRGIAFAELKRLDETIADCSKAIALKPGLVAALINRGNAYKKLKRFDQAITDYSKAIELKPDWADAWMFRAGAFAESRQFDQAVADYSKAIALKADYAEAWTNRGNVHKELKQFEQAIADHSKATEVNPNLAEAWNNRGNVRWLLKQFDQALIDCSKALELNPDLPEAWLSRGNAFAGLRQFDRAIADYSKAVELKPDWAEAWNNRGSAFANLGKLDRAIGDYSKAIALKPDYVQAFIDRGNAFADSKQFDNAIADYSKAIELQPDDANPRNNRGIVHRALKQLDKALADYSKAIELKPDWAGAWYNRANVHLELEQFDKAIADYSKAIALQPNWASAWYNRGNSYRELKQCEKAVADYSKAIDLRPNHAPSRYNRGLAYAELKQFDQAVVDFRKAIELKPDLVGVFIQLGHALAAKGELEKAIAAYHQSLQIDPPDLCGEACLGAGKCLARLGAYAEAIEKYRVALRSLPNSAEVHNHLARLLATCPDAKLRDAPRAVEMAKKAVELAPGDGGCWNTLGAAHYRAGDWKAAINALEKSMKLRKGGDSSDWFFVAMAHWQLGNREEARKWYEKAVAWMDKNQPDNEELRRFRAEAEELLKRESGVRNQESEKVPATF